MRFLTKILVFLLVLGVAKLNAYTKSPQLTTAESNVLKTITYGAGSGLLVNTVCSLAAPALDPEIPSSDSFVSCTPFGLATSLIVARVYVFTSGGWGWEHWWYLNQLPKIVENGVRETLGLEQKPLPAKPRPRVPVTETEQILDRVEL